MQILKLHTHVLITDKSDMSNKKRSWFLFLNVIHYIAPHYSGRVKQNYAGDRKHVKFLNGKEELFRLMGWW